MFTTEQFSLTAIIVSGLQKLNPYTSLLTDLFIILCVFLLLIAIFKRRSRFAKFAPTLLTSFGLLGIFLGTVIGLSVFDEQQLETSLAELFNGLGMAFITGVIGIFSALLVKLFNRQKAKPMVLANITPTDIYRVLTEIREHSANQNAILVGNGEKANAQQQYLQKVLKLQQVGFAQQVRLLEELNHSLCGENDNSLATQLQKWRASTEKTAKDSNQTLVQIIESPMKYFTNTIGEQIGENFQQINQAVAALHRWQHDYHEQIISSVDDVNNSRVALGEMVTHIKAIPQTMQQLVPVIQSLQQQLQDTGQHLEGFQSLDQQTGKVLPLIETHLNDLAQGQRQQIQLLETQLDLAEAALENQLEGFNLLQNRITDLQSKISDPGKALSTQAPPINPTDEKIPIIEVPPIDTIIDQLATAAEEPPEDSEIAELLQTTTTVTKPAEYAELPQTAITMTKPDDLEVNTPEYYEFLQNKAFAFMELGHYQPAITYFDQVIEINCAQFSSFYNKACCYALLAQVDLAIVALQQAIYLNTECIEMAKTDSDFDKIRYDTRFRSQLELIDNKYNGY